MKYKDLVFYCPDDEILFTAINKMSFIRPGKKNGWAVMGVPEGDDGTNTDTQQPFILRDNIIGEMVKDTQHPQESHIEVVRERPIHNDESDNNDEESDSEEENDEENEDSVQD